MNSFRTAYGATSKNGVEIYRSEGRLVNRELLCNKVNGVECKNIYNLINKTNINIA